MLALFDAHSHLPETTSLPEEHLRVICGTCEADWEAVLAHAASNARVIPMLGLHPWHVEAAEVMAVAAAIRGAPVEDLAAQTWENGQRCFKELLA